MTKLLNEKIFSQYARPVTMSHPMSLLYQTERKKKSIFLSCYELLFNLRENIFILNERQRNTCPVPLDPSSVSAGRVDFGKSKQLTENTRFVEVSPKLFISINYMIRNAYGRLNFLESRSD